MITALALIAATDPAWLLQEQHGCQLVRSLYSATTEAQFTVDLSVLDRTMLTINIPSKPGRRWVSGSLGATLRIMPGDGQVSPIFWDEQADSRGARIEFFVPARSLDLISKADVVEVVTNETVVASFPTDGLRETMPKLIACKEALEKQFDIDPAEDVAAATNAPILTPKKGSSAPTRSDYPVEAIQARAEGSTTIVWTMNPDGTTSDCRVVVTSGNQYLDKASCDLILQRERYEPGPVGIRKHATRRVNWLLPPS